MSGNTDKKTVEDNQAVEQKDEQSLLASEAITEVPDVSSDVEQQEPAGEVQQEAPADKSTEDLLQEIEVQKKLVGEHKDRALRAQAELENMRKRTLRDIENAHKYALEKFINELLPVLDSMELGMSASTSAENIDSLKEGMDLTLKKFSSTLEKFGVKVIDPQGEKFNPELHEAVSVQEQKGVASGHVITVMQKGYELNGRLIRPAMVMVAK